MAQALSRSDLDRFGPSAQARVIRALADVRRGRPVVLVDHEDRENEGDLIVAAERITAEWMAFMIRYCSGIVCLCLTEPDLERLELPQMVADNTSRHGTAFTVSIEAATGVTTGVSAADRVRTVQVAMNTQSEPADLARPGHVFPLRAAPGGVLARPGHTEGSVDLAALAGFRPAAVLCELMNDDGTMARLAEIVPFARRHDLRVLSIEDLLAYWQQAAQGTADKAAP